MRIRKLEKRLENRWRKDDPVPAKSVTQKHAWGRSTFCSCGKHFVVGEGYARPDLFQLFCSKECALLYAVVH